MPAFPRLPRRPGSTDRDDRGPKPDAAPAGAAVSGAVAALLLLGAGSVALFGGGPAPVAVRSLPAAPAGPTTPTAGPMSVAGPTGAAQPTAVTGPLLTGPPVSWQLFSGVALPTSPSYGPRTVDGPVYAGYQRSQAGALIAAAQIGTRYLLTPGQGWRDVARLQLLPGTGRAVFLTARAGVDELTVPPGTYGQLAGFRVVTFTPDVAVLQLISRFALTGRLQLTTTTLKWVGGDWRLELQPDGGSSPTAQQVPDLDGFVVWGGA